MISVNFPHLDSINICIQFLETAQSNKARHPIMRLNLLMSSYYNLHSISCGTVFVTVKTQFSKTDLKLMATINFSGIKAEI